MQLVVVDVIAAEYAKICITPHASMEGVTRTNSVIVNKTPIMRADFRQIAFSRLWRRADDGHCLAQLAFLANF